MYNYYIMSYFVYVIYNTQNDKIYVGQTVDLINRLKQHNDYSFKKFTSRYKGGWVLIYKESLSNRQEAMSREKELKSFQGRNFIKNKIVSLKKE